MPGNIVDEVDPYERLTREVREHLFDEWRKGKIDTGIVAYEAKMNKVTIDNFLHGKTRKPRWETVVKIADAIDFEFVLVRKGAKLTTGIRFAGVLPTKSRRK
jgi:hypothetical protein